MKVRAYFEEWSRRPGERVRLAISTALPEVRADLVRLTTGPGAAGESRIGTEPVAGVLDRTVPCRLQNTPVGSYARLPLGNGISGGAFTIHCSIWPTLPSQAAQTVWCLNQGSAAVRLVLAQGRLSLVGDGLLVTSEMLIEARKWYSVVAAAGLDATALDVHLIKGHTQVRSTRATGRGAKVGAPNEMLLASTGPDDSRHAKECYNGKIASPRFFPGALTPQQCQKLHAAGQSPVSALAEWLIGGDWSSREIRSLVAGVPSGALINGAERGVTGPNWDGSSDSFIETPEQYCALQFHEDDMVDAKWRYDLDFLLPDGISSGVYAVRLSAGTEIEHFPLFVMAPKGEKASALFLASTNTYLAYANDHLASLDFSQVMNHSMVVPEDEKLLFTDRGFGRSCYDTHSDGTPVRYSSRRRPIINIRPGYPNWLTGSYRHFPQDMYIVEWLVQTGLSFHVATDEDLHREGKALLDNYQVIVTGSHPEYWTRHGHDTLDRYLKTGGRLMYLGGNGFYWVTSHDPERPWIIEVRRDNSGTRCWDAPYGERMHVTTSEQGGIWKTRGKGPHGLVGVGFAAEGWSKASGYRRLEASRSGPGAVFFEGVSEDVVGDFGHVLGGAVGDEVDRHDVSLGSPAHAHILASSTPLGNEYQLVIEEQILALPDQGGSFKPDRVRSDMVYFTTDNGGAVFSIGSMTYAGAIAWNNYDNNIARITTNVLRSFASKSLPE
ncbi:large subunit of N,N-dimethylformamidase [soil metagenome]